jgi:hypothetical protein
VKVILNKSTEHWLEAETGWKNLNLGIPVTDVEMHPAFYATAEKIK